MTRSFPMVDTVWELVDNAAREWPEKTALISDTEGRSFTFSELKVVVENAAARLCRLGVRPGDFVAVMLENRIDYPVIWLACARIGAAMVPINSNHKVLDAGHILRHSSSRIVISDRARRDVLNEVKAELGTLKVIIDIDVDWLEIEPDAATLPQPPRGGETTLNVQYTSGTTGRPKGCVLSHTYWLTMAYKNVVEVPGLASDDVLLTAQPFSYMDPQWNLASSLASGATLVLLDRFHPSTLFDTVQRFGVTFFYCLGVMPTLLLKYPPTPADRNHRLRLIACSGIPGGLHAELEERYGVPWVETYGMTEIGNAAAMTLEDRESRVGSGAIGRSTSKREVRIVDEHDRPVDRGEVGEIVVRGVGLMDGYLHDPEATAEAFRGGWFHTGDLGYLDDAGFLYFVGRKKEMIRRSGENISATEVEETILSHPAVRMAVCLPVPDDIRGEEIKAIVVLDEGVDTSFLIQEELPAHCSRLLSYFKVPRYWEHRNELPLTVSSKVSRGQLSDIADISGCWDRVEGRWR